ncbi:MAG: methyltransferase domain-containing protein [Bryobacteraceae bacterium]|nr:methyltransferase domain-containing protein [Bryobacteraceae bacterium]
MRPAATKREGGREQRRGSHTAARIAFWDRFARESAGWRGLRGYYRRRLAELYRFLVPEGMRVLELGCAQGDLLAQLRPSTGVGVDFSPEMIRRARERHPALEFVLADAHDFRLQGTFDFVIASDLVNDLWDVQAFLENLRPHCHPGTRILMNAHSRLWELPRRMAESLGLVTRQLQQNWLTVEDLSNLLQLSGFETIRTSQEILWPVRTPLIDTICNRYLVKLWPFRHLGITNFVVARPEATPREDCLVSVVVAARNEAGNIPAIFDRVPEMGLGTELIFVEGHSIDDTWGAIGREMEVRKRPRTQRFQQTGKGKGDAVRLGFQEASGELFMILDADLTVPPEDLPRFYEAWRSGKGEFINGVRLVYPMEEGAMRFFNLLGNKFFSVAFTWLLSQSIKDTLCGTKVLSRSDYSLIAANRAYFGDFDPFGDFDLIFGAARYNRRFVDLPVRYGERVYGETNIQRWRHGLLLLRMVLFAMRRIKFV